MYIGVPKWQFLPLFCYNSMVAGLFCAAFVLFCFYITIPTIDGAVTTCPEQMARPGP